MAGSRGWDPMERGKSPNKEGMEGGVASLGEMEKNEERESETFLRIQNVEKMCGGCRGPTGFEFCFKSVRKL